MLITIHFYFPQQISLIVWRDVEPFSKAFMRLAALLSFSFHSYTRSVVFDVISVIGIVVSRQVIRRLIV